MKRQEKRDQPQPRGPLNKCALASVCGGVQKVREARFGGQDLGSGVQVTFYYNEVDW